MCKTQQNTAGLFLNPTLFLYLMTLTWALVCELGMRMFYIRNIVLAGILNNPPSLPFKKTVKVYNLIGGGHDGRVIIGELVWAADKSILCISAMCENLETPDENLKPPPAADRWPYLYLHPLTRVVFLSDLCLVLSPWRVLVLYLKSERQRGVSTLHPSVRPRVFSMEKVGNCYCGSCETVVWFMF